MRNYNSEATSETQIMEKKKKNRLLVRKGQKYVNLKIAEIPFFFAEGKLVFAYDREGNKYICDENLSQLADGLDAAVFFRASRKYLVNIDYIKSFQSFERVKLLLELNVPDMKHRIIISQVTTPLFKNWINTV